jgi:hypothetical protein
VLQPHGVLTMMAMMNKLIHGSSFYSSGSNGGFLARARGGGGIVGTRDRESHRPPGPDSDWQLQLLWTVGMKEGEVGR